MDPEAAILEWIKPASIKAGGDGDLWQSGMSPETWFIRSDANKDYDDKIFNPDFYEKIKVDEQYYFNNSGVYLIVDNTIIKPMGTKDMMRLELQYDEFLGVWVLQPFINPDFGDGGKGDQVKIEKLNERAWNESDYAKSIRRSPSHWDIYYLLEYIGNPSFRPLNWTQFPETLLP